MKKKFTLCAGVGSLILAASAGAAYQGMVAEESSESGTNLFGDSWAVDTVRIYVVLDTGDRLDAVNGTPDNPLYIQTSAEFYQNVFGGDSSMQINPALFGAYNSSPFDTFVTIGQLSSADNALLTQGVDFSSFDTTVNTANGSWFVTPDDAQGEAGAGGLVLIGQFSFEAGTGGMASMTGNVNLQGKLASGENWEAFNQWVPAPGALALLGLAGIAGRRRRRN